jgi:hypothetical protein
MQFIFLLQVRSTRYNIVWATNLMVAELDKIMAASYYMLSDVMLTKNAIIKMSTQFYTDSYISTILYTDGVDKI